MPIDAVANDGAPQKLVRISPNSSLKPHQARLFLYLVVFSTLLVSGSIALAGYWLVLPFAGLEVAAIFVALNLSMKRSRYQEVIRISEEKIVVEKGEKEVQERVEFPRYWASAELVPSSVAAYPSKLLLGCMGRSLEIGACLTEAERRGLKRRLSLLIGPAQSLPAVFVPTANG